MRKTASDFCYAGEGSQNIPLAIGGRGLVQERCWLAVVGACSILSIVTRYADTARRRSYLRHTGRADESILTCAPVSVPS